MWARNMVKQKSPLKYIHNSVFIQILVSRALPTPLQGILVSRCNEGFTKDRTKPNTSIYYIPHLYRKAPDFSHSMILKSVFVL